jgi:DNA-binding NarL/FixJ family response regulator
VNLRVTVVEDDDHYRGSLEILLALEPGFELAGSHSDASSLVTHVTCLPADAPVPWDLTLMDIDLPGMSGIEATRAIKAARPEAKIVMLTAFEDPGKILEAIRAGADGYLLKRAGVTEVIEQLRVVASGGAPMTPGIARSVLDLLREGAPRARHAPAGLELSERERAVLGALVRGLAYKQVAAELDLSIDTVRTYIRRIYTKLQVHSATEAVARAVRENLTD